MNKNEKLIASILGIILVVFLGWNFFSSKPVEATKTATPAPATASATPTPSTTPSEVTPVASEAKVETSNVAAISTATFFTLENGDLKMTISSHDGALTTATFNPEKYPEKNEPGSAPLTLTLVDLLKVKTPGQTAIREFKVKRYSGNKREITLEAAYDAKGVMIERTFALDETGYHLTVKDRFVNNLKRPVTLEASMIHAGVLSGAPGDLAVGAYDTDEEEVVLRIVQGAGCGCSCSETLDEKPTKPQRWIALNNRYFLTLLAPQSPTMVTMDRVVKSKEAAVSGALQVPALNLPGGSAVEQTYHLYVGPKVYDNLTSLEDLVPNAEEASEMMDFGMFGWFAKLLLKGMNLFYAMIPNYGVAIILLTILIRILFWPLTRKSTLAMRKMAEIQPLIKEVQEKFKGNPQKIQQETFMLYRKHQVNPLASCLPMLIQIPIFIAFFNMLRSVAELRFAGFLWISDLSQPENLFVGVLPVALNILPILTAVTMALQSHLTPSAGDPSQKKMMTWMMPIMMLFFFYNMSSALCLYWTVSQLLSIAQMYVLRKKSPQQA